MVERLQRQRDRRRDEAEPHAESSASTPQPDHGINPFANPQRGGQRDIKAEDQVSTGAPAPSAALEAEIARLHEVVADRDRKLREATVRAAAADDEVERAKKRLRKEALRDLELRGRNMLLSFLEVLDDLDRAVAANKSEPNSVVAQGVALVRKRFLDKLARYGVAHDPALGQRFDPARHDAMSMVPVSDAESDGRVIAVMREGYAIGDEVLRPAGVAVARWNGDN